MPNRKALTPVKILLKKGIPPLVAACGGDYGLAELVTEWVNNGRNATKAYKKLHPNVAEGTARVMGSALMKKVDKTFLAELYCGGIDTYFKQLNDGLNANVVILSGGKKKVLAPDHRVRRLYHEALGKMLGIEEEGRGQANVQVNVQNVLSELANE